MRIVGFDTATPATAVAMLDPSGEISRDRRDPRPGERPGHAAELLPLLEGLLARCGVGWSEVDRLAVGVGPGGFTGLRIGIATARALAQARELPVVGVSSLETLAAGTQAPLVLAVLDARRGEAFAAGWDAGRCIVAAAARKPDELAREAGRMAQEGGRSPLAVGDGAVRFRTRLEDAGATVPHDAAPEHLVDAAYTCRIAGRGREVRGGALLPDYHRVPDAELSTRTPSP